MCKICGGRDLVDLGRWGMRMLSVCQDCGTHSSRIITVEELDIPQEQEIEDEGNKEDY